MAHKGGKMTWIAFFGGCIVGALIVVILIGIFMFDDAKIENMDAKPEDPRLGRFHS